MNSLETFLITIRDKLSHAALEIPGNYLDLAATQHLVTLEGLQSHALPADNLAGFQEMVLAQITLGNTDKIKISINELLKHLLLSLSPEKEEVLAEKYLARLKMIFKSCLMPGFPFAEEIWNYICDCLRTTGSFLIELGYFTACREVIDFLAGTGRIAALKGLPTAGTQSSLRILENKAGEKGQKPLAAAAKNARFNLET